MRRTAAYVGIVALAAGAVAVAAPAVARGTTSAGTISVSPTSAVAGAVTNYVLRYQAKGGFTHQTIRFGIPDGFTTPVMGGPAPGNVVLLKGTCTTPQPPYLGSGPVGATWIQLDDVSCPKGGNFVQLGYNSATATTAATYTFPGFLANAGAAPGKVKVSPAAAAQSNFAFADSPGDGPAGTNLSPAPKVSVFDTYGNAITGGDVTLALRTYPADAPAAFLSGDTTQPPVAGYATFPGMKVAVAGVYTLRATRGSLTATSAPFTINPAAPAQLALVNPIHDAAADSVLGVQVAIQDAYGNLEKGDSTTVVNAAIKAPNVPGGTLSGFSSGPTASGGIATFPNLSIDRQGVYTLTLSASPGGTPLTLDSNAFTINTIVNRPLTGAGNWAGTYGTQEWWLFEYGLPASVTPDVPPNLKVDTDGAGATLGDLTTSGASGWSYSGDTADDRALQNPCFNPPANCGSSTLDPSVHRASGVLFSDTSFSTVLQFANAFTGKLTVYAVDWDDASRVQTVTVHDALGDQTVSLTSFTGGAYATFNITTGPASNVTVTATNGGGSANAVIAGMFLN